MKKYMFLILLVFTFLKVDANMVIDSVYLKHAKIFIEQIYGEKLTLPRLVLLDDPKFGCDFNYVDKSFFTKEVIITINQQIKKPKINSWNSFLQLEIKLLTKDSINNIFKKDYLRLYNGWKYFNKYIGTEINQISVPIFIRNYTYCLFYNDYVCGFRCGFGVLKLYKLENNHWIEVKELSSWVS